ARQRQLVAPPAIVFQGNVPAVLSKNHLLEKMLTAPPQTEPAAAARVWLGDAVAIKDPTSAFFRRQSGGNLLIIGQYEEAALGLMTAALMSLAAQHAPGDLPEGNGGTRFYVLGGGPVEGVSPGLPAILPQVVPHVV